MRLDCFTCGESFERRPSQANRSKRHFCSRSCAAKTNNSLHPKRKLNEKRVCPDCNGRKDPSAIRCHRCKRLAWLFRTEKQTLAEVEVKSHPLAYKYNQVRKAAREKMKLVGPDKRCSVCNFTHVVHVAHIRAITEFEPSAILAEVNALSNLAYLCPNHHAMFDLGLMELPERIELSSFV